jgi:hypothetical protein
MAYPNFWVPASSRIEGRDVADSDTVAIIAAVAGIAYRLMTGHLLTA